MPASLSKKTDAIIRFTFSARLPYGCLCFFPFAVFPGVQPGPQLCNRPVINLLRGDGVVVIQQRGKLREAPGSVRPKFQMKRQHTALPGGQRCFYQMVQMLR